jgi:glutamate transport system permease protein
MSGAPSVLFDAPGPKARLRNIIYTVIFGLVLAGVIIWVLSILSSMAELAPSKWKPFVTEGVWTTFLLPGLWQTLKAAGLSLLIALPVGAILGLGRMSDHVWIRWPASIIVEFFRAIPVLLLMVFAKALFVLADIGTADNRPLLAVVTGLVLYNGAVLAEVFRAGVLSLAKGQTEASLAIGLRKGQYMRLILLPQALTVMLPAIVSQLVVIVKDTALGSQLTIAFPELLASARTITANYGNTVATYTVIALIYIVVDLILIFLAGRSERWMRTRRGGGGGAKRGGLATTGVMAETEMGAPIVDDEMLPGQRSGFASRFDRFRFVLQHP